jgi:hypothetical protein
MSNNWGLPENRANRVLSFKTLLKMSSQDQALFRQAIFKFLDSIAIQAVLKASDENAEDVVSLVYTIQRCKLDLSKEHSLSSFRYAIVQSSFSKLESK